MAVCGIQVQHITAYIVPVSVVGLDTKIHLLTDQHFFISKNKNIRPDLVLLISPPLGPKSASNRKKVEIREVGKMEKRKGTYHFHHTEIDKPTFSSFENIFSVFRYILDVP